MVLMIETQCRLVSPARVLSASGRFAELRDVQQLAEHHLAAGRLLLGRPRTMHREFRMLLERRMTLLAVVICVFGQALKAAMLLMTHGTVGHSLRHGEWIVIVLALVMTVLTVFIANRS